MTVLREVEIRGRWYVDDAAEPAAAAGGSTATLVRMSDGARMKCVPRDSLAPRQAVATAGNAIVALAAIRDDYRRDARTWAGLLGLLGEDLLTPDLTRVLSLGDMALLFGPHDAAHAAGRYVDWSQDEIRIRMADRVLMPALWRLEDDRERLGMETALFSACLFRIGEVGKPPLGGDTPYRTLQWALDNVAPVRNPDDKTEVKESLAKMRAEREAQRRDILAAFPPYALAGSPT